MEWRCHVSDVLEAAWWQSSAPDGTIPTVAPQPYKPAQLDPQIGAMSIANTVAIAMELTYARLVLSVSFGVLILNESTLR